MTVQRIKFRIKNNGSNPYLISITDRPVEIKTTSLGAGADQLPPMSELTTYFGDDDVFVLAPDGIGIEKEEENAE
jgi:hypothetical protein